MVTVVVSLGLEELEPLAEAAQNMAVPVVLVDVEATVKTIGLLPQAALEPPEVLGKPSMVKIFCCLCLIYLIWIKK